MLRAINRFFLNQMFYPLVLSSFLATVVYIGRFFISGDRWVYSNLPWNLFLAWVPYGFSFLAVALHRISRRTWLLQLPLGALWLLFFPNAPYLVTDFLHLGPQELIPLWYDTILLAIFAWSGCYLAVASLIIMQRLIQSYLGKIAGWFFVFVAIFLSGLGTYLGRFERWNSWDIWANPKGIAKDLLIPLSQPLANPRFLGFTLLFTAFMLICYLTFISVRYIDEKE